MDIYESEECRQKITKVVKIVGEELLSYEGEVRDLQDPLNRAHASSTVDKKARSIMMSALENEFPDVNITMQFELRPLKISYIWKSGEPKNTIHFIIDEIDGTTNFKRWAKSKRNCRPR